MPPFLETAQKYAPQLKWEFGSHTGWRRIGIGEVGSKFVTFVLGPDSKGRGVDWDPIREDKSNRHQVLIRSPNHPRKLWSGRSIKEALHRALEDLVR